MWLSVRLCTVKFLQVVAMKCDCSEALAKIIYRSMDTYCMLLGVNSSPGDC